MRRRSFLLAPLAPLLFRKAAAATPPNVVLILAQGWRGQAVPWAGDPDVFAPNLARLGRESLTFSRAYSGDPRLIPARRILLNGRFFHEAVLDEIALNNQSVGARLKAAGYRAAVFGDRAADDIVSFVHAPGSQPFYAEWTWSTAAGFMERVDAAGLHIRPNVPASQEGAARGALADFYARCRVRDQEIGIVLAALDRPELRDNTLVVFASDRGEQIGSHGLTSDDSFYEESVRIPLAMQHPRLERGGQRDMLVSQADIAPTILGLCGIPVPEQMQGRDLSALIVEGKGEQPDAVFAEGRLSEPEEWRMLVHGYDKLVTDASGNPTHLFNLQRDPYEMTNLVSVSAEKLNRDVMVAMLQLWRRKLADGRDPSGLRKR